MYILFILILNQIKTTRILRKWLHFGPQQLELEQFNPTGHRYTYMCVDCAIDKTKTTHLNRNRFAHKIRHDICILLF